MAGSAIVGILRALLTANTAEFDSALRSSAESAKAWSRDLKQVGQQASQVGAALTKTLTIPILGIGVGAAKMAVDFETAFSGVKKTVSGTPDELAKINTQIREMAKTSPVSAVGIAKIAESAGQLGVGKDKIVAFAKTIVDISTVTNLTADEAGTAFAKLANVMHVPQDAFKNLGSAVYQLGNFGASTEQEMLGMAQRIAAAGASAGLTAPEVLGISNALASVGIEAEAGGTAVSRVITKIAGDVASGAGHLEDFARVAGLSSEAFQKAWKTDAGTALAAFFKGLSELKDKGESLFSTMDDLGFKEVRLKNAMLSAANAGSLMTDSMNLGKKAFEDTAKFTQAAEERYKTTANQLQILRNKLTDVGITVGNALLPAIHLIIKGFDAVIPLIDGVGKFFAGLPTPIQAVVVGAGLLAAALGPLIFVMGQLMISGSQVVGMFTKKGLAMRLLKGDTEALTLAMTGLGRVTGVLAGVFIAWEVGSAVAEAHTAHLEAMKKAAEDLSKADQLIADKQNELTQARKNGNDMLAASLYAELQSLKSGRDAAQQALITAKAEQAKADATAAATLQTQEQAKARQSMSDIIAKAEASIRTEIAKTGKSVGELTQLLKTNETGFNAVVKEYGLSAEAVKFLKDQLDKQTEAQKKAKDATKEATEEEKKQRDELKALGLITQNEVNETLAHMGVLWTLVTKEGWSASAFLDAVIPQLEDLGKKAKKSGLDVSDLEESIRNARAELAKLPPPTTFTTATPFTPTTIANIGIAVKSLAQVPTAAQFAQMALKDLGITSQASSDQAARAAEQSWKDIVAVYGSGSKEAKDAYQKYLKALADAQDDAVKAALAKDQILFQSIGQIGSAVGGSFGKAIGLTVQFASALDTLSKTAKTSAEHFAASANIYVLAAQLAIQAISSAYQAGQNAAERTREANRKQILAEGKDQSALFKNMFQSLQLGNGVGEVVRQQVDALVQRFVDQASKSDKAWSQAFQSLIAQAKAAGYEIAGLADLIAQQQEKLGNASAGLAHDLAASVQASYDKQTQTALAFFDQQIAAAQDNEDTVKHLEAEKAAYIKKKQGEIAASTQAEFDRVNRIILRSFNTLIASGISFPDAVAQIGGGLDELIAAADTFGFAGNEAFERLKRWRELTTELQPVLDTVNNLNTILVTSANLNALTADSFADLEAQGVQAYNDLIAGGMSQQEAELAEKDFLETIIQLHKDKGLAIDEATQKLIDQAEADGVVGEKQKTTNEILEDSFKALGAGIQAIVIALKGDVPDALRDLADDSKSNFKEVEDNARAAGRTIADAFNKNFTVGVEFDTSGRAGIDVGDRAASVGAGLTPMATGGIVTRPTMILAGEAGPEAIVPLSQLRGMSKTTNITLQVHTPDADGLRRLLRSTAFRKELKDAITDNAGNMGAELSRALGRYPA